MPDDINTIEPKKPRLEELRRELMTDEFGRPKTEAEKIETYDLEKDIREAEIIVRNPEPEKNQEILWQKLDKTISSENMEREFNFYLLPEEVTSSLASEKTSFEIRNIAGKYGLDERKISLLASIIKDLYIAEFNLKDFIRAISQILEIDAETAKSLAKDIANEILSRDKEFLKVLHSTES